MDSHKRQNWFRQLAHPSEEELLRFLDGELGEKQAAKVRTHLESCWDCRVKREETECSILAFVGYRKAALAQAGELPPRARLSFEQRLSRLAEASKESNGRRLLSQWRSLFSGSLLAGEGFLARNAMRLATAAVVCVILLFVFLRLDWERPVSAGELLRRMEQAETQRLNRVAHPVIYQKLKVRRQSGGGVQTVTWETWRDLGDPGEHRFRQRIEDHEGARFINSNNNATPRLLLEIEEVLRANRMDARRPLSAAGFAAWRATLAQKSEVVAKTTLPDGELALRLTISVSGPVAVNKIMSAELLVRARDWHPLAQRLKVQGEHETKEYELSETSSEVVALEVVNAALFTEPAPVAVSKPVAHSPTGTPLPAATPFAPVAPLPSAAELAAAEVEARYALHRVKADLGEQVEVTRETTVVVVRGLAETPRRKAEWIEALRGLPLVTAHIQTIEEAAALRPSMTVPAKTVPATPTANPTANEDVPATGETVVADPTVARNAFQEQLARYFAERESADRRAVQEQVAWLSNDVVSESTAALSEAWALRRLLERYGAESELAPAARQRIEEMAANHLARLKAQSRKLRARLEPALLSMTKAPGSSAPPPESTKQAQALLVFRAVEQAQQMTHRLFAGAGSAATPEEAARQLLAALDRLDQALLSFEQAITR